MKKVTAVLLGAGDRGMSAYGSYALANPDELQFVAVAEPRQDRRKKFQELHGIKDEMAFANWQDLLDRPQMADAVLICTWDRMCISSPRSRPSRKATTSSWRSRSPRTGGMPGHRRSGQEI